MTRSKLALARAGATLAVSLGALGAWGCSSTSATTGGSDSGSITANYDAAIGVGLTSCVPSVCMDPALCGMTPNCPPPGLCGGTLLGPNTPISYCTVYCSKDADCPSGSACEKKVTGGHCLKTCTSDTACSGGFACRLDGGTAGSLCWSPYSGADGFIDAGSSVDTGAPDVASAEGGGPDAGGAPDAAPDGPPDATPDGEAASDSASDVAADVTGG